MAPGSEMAAFKICRKAAASWTQSKRVSKAPLGRVQRRHGSRQLGGHEKAAELIELGNYECLLSESSGSCRRSAIVA
jgi:hypothetical protein